MGAVTRDRRPVKQLELTFDLALGPPAVRGRARDTNLVSGLRDRAALLHPADPSQPTCVGESGGALLAREMVSHGQ